MANSTESSYAPVVAAPVAARAGPTVLSDIWTMGSNPWETSTTFVTGLGETFLDGSAYDSFRGGSLQMLDNMFGWTGTEVFDPMTNGPAFGNWDTFQDGRWVGGVATTSMNMALLGYSIVSLPASFNFMINSLTWVTFSLGGMQYVVHGGMVSVIGGIQVSLPAIPLVAVVPVVIDATGAVAAYMVMSAEQPLPDAGNTAGAGSGPTMTQWGWSGSPSWRAAVNEVGMGGELRTVGGRVPTYAEAVELIESAGGTIQRVEGPRAAGGVAAHIDFNHINYTTSSGLRSHLGIQSLPPSP